MGHEAKCEADTHNGHEVNPAQRTGCNSLDSIFSKAQIAIWRAFPSKKGRKVAPMLEFEFHSARKRSGPSMQNWAPD